MVKRRDTFKIDAGAVIRAAALAAVLAVVFTKVAKAETGYGWIECLSGDRTAPTLVTTEPRLFRYDIPPGADGVISDDALAELPAMLNYMGEEERANAIALQTENMIARALYFEPQIAMQFGDSFKREAAGRDMACTLSPPKAPGPFQTPDEARTVQEAATEGLKMFLDDLNGTRLKVTQIALPAK